MEHASSDHAAATMRGIAGVTLAVRDIDRVARFYREVIGLPIIEDEGARVVLGEGGLLELVQRPDAIPAPAGGAGLYHTAFLLPDRSSLGGWLTHLAGTGVALDGAADHLVSEAVYLRDPEGNGVEVYADRPRSAWQWSGGGLRMANQRLDLAALRGLAEAPWAGAPVGTGIGHVHLRVGDAGEAGRFYAGALNMDVTVAYPQAVFLSWDGYHHHLAANAWDSAGALPRAPGEAGLVRVSLRGAEAADITDPWGNAFRVVPLHLETMP